MKDQEVVDLIVAAVRRARRKGCPIDLLTIGVETNGEGVYKLEREHGSVCLMGAVMLGKKAVAGSFEDDFAKVCGHNAQWGDGFMEGTINPAEDPAYLKATYNPNWVRGYRLAARAIKRVRELKLVD